jgi:hypothetical protein
VSPFYGSHSTPVPFLVVTQGDASREDFQEFVDRIDKKIKYTSVHREGDGIKLLWRLSDGQAKYLKQMKKEQ